MGATCCKESAPKAVKLGLPSEERQVSTWIKTGIVGLRDRGLRELPASVASVGTDAKALDATNNKLQQFPSLGTLTALQRLTLAFNEITVISIGALLPLALSLKVLVLDGNALTQLPDELGCLVHLEKLSLRKNQLVELNPCIARLTALQFLLVSHNSLSALPAAIEVCTALEEIDACDNSISAIPTSFGNLQRLKTLNLSNNSISQVPPAVFLNCCALQTLGLHGNPIEPDTVHATEGFEAFEQRRRDKYSKGIAGGVVIGARGLDEGLDRKLKT